MGVRGLSVLFSAGDNGIQSNYIGNDNCTYAHPEWPASNPYGMPAASMQFVVHGNMLCPVSSYLLYFICSNHRWSHSTIGLLCSRLR